MSETLCTLRTKGGGGGKQTETVLWTNSAPTSSFAKQDVTLSDDINNYDYLKLTYRVTTSVADLLSYIISVSDFKKSVETTSYHHCILGLSTDDSVAHTRRVYYKTDTTVNFNNAYQLNAAASNNATVIPTQIVGIKNMGGKGWAGSSMFSIATCSGGSTTQYSSHVITNDSSLVDKAANQNSSGTVTLKRDAKGKIYFDNSGRGTRSVNASFTFKGVSYNPNDYWTNYQSGISVDFSANDTISYSCGKSVSLDTAILIFVEDA